MKNQERLPIALGSFAFWGGFLLFSNTLSPLHKLIVIEMALIGLSLSLLADGKLNVYITTNLKNFEKMVGICLSLYNFLVLIINILNFFNSSIFFFLIHFNLLG